MRRVSRLSHRSSTSVMEVQCSSRDEPIFHRTTNFSHTQFLCCVLSCPLCYADFIHSNAFTFIWLSSTVEYWCARAAESDVCAEIFLRSFFCVFSHIPWSHRIISKAIDHFACWARECWAWNVLRDSMAKVNIYAMMMMHLTYWPPPHSPCADRMTSQSKLSGECATKLNESQLTVFQLSLLFTPDEFSYSLV